MPLRCYLHAVNTSKIRNYLKKKAHLINLYYYYFSTISILPLHYLYTYYYLLKSYHQLTKIPIQIHYISIQVLSLPTQIPLPAYQDSIIYITYPLISHHLPKIPVHI
jgi:hypothetical protein